MSIKKELQDLCSKHRGIFAEYPIKESDYLLVFFEVCDQGLFIKSDFKEERFFSGEVIERETGFIIPFDNYKNIDEYLEIAVLEIQEGYIIPNKLYRDD